MRNSILKIENGTFSYEVGRKAIANINLEISKGEKIAVIGNNGAGKSTFFLALNGVLRLNDGEIYYHGKKLDYKRESLYELRKNVGMVFQNPDDQIVGSTVAAEISFGLFNAGFDKEQVRSKVDKIINEMSLGDYRDRPPHYLSGGEKKRVCIADILVMDPEIILFDEPTASLDYKNIKLLKEQMQCLHNKGVTLLVSTHDINFVWEWADRVLVFLNGEIIADDTPQMIFANEEILNRAGVPKPLLLEYQITKC